MRVLLFYAPWCKSCRILEPEYFKAAEKLKDSKIKFAKVDGTLIENQDLANQMNVVNYPTIKFYFPNENLPNPYEGPRTAEGIISFFQGKFTLKEELKKLIHLKKLRLKFPEYPFVVGVFPKESDAQLWFKEIVSEKIDVYKFALYQ